jgi:hypothetical protein
MTHSFFAIMGGFVVGHSPHSTERATLTGKAILHTARTENTLPDIPRSSIQDRSKSNGLGKILVCIQAGYTILQILGRLKSNLAVTLLEINTLGHVLCALLLYAFWFNKPLDVKDPIVLTPRWAHPLEAVWSMRSRIFELHRTRDRRQARVKEREVFDHFRYETLQRITSSSERSSEAEFFAEARNLTHEYRSCGRDASLAPGAYDLIDRASVGTFHEEQRPLVTTGLPLPDARSRSIDDTSNRAATPVEANSPELLTPTQVRIIRRIPSTYEIGTWETTDLVLIWHGIDDSFDDDAVRRELRDCPLWSGVSRIYCVDRGLGDACYFRSAPAVFSETLNDYMVVNTAATDRICGVQLDLPGLRRWKAVYEAACDSLYTKDTFEDSALKRIEKGTTPHAGHGLDIYDACRYWAEDKSKNQFLRHGIPNWPSGAGYLRPPRKWIPKASLTFITACYASLHATAWHFSFPSKNEQILWRVSALTIASTCFAFLLCDILSSVDEWRENHYFTSLWSLVLIVGCGFLTAYCFARFFIVLEAFISLRKLPLSAYDTPRWATLLPHL